MANSGDTCGKMTGTGVVNYPCVLPPHDGPCVAREIPATAIARAKWEKDKSRSSKAKAPPVDEAEVELAGLGGEDAAAAAAPLAAIVDSVGPDDIGIYDEEPDDEVGTVSPPAMEHASILPIDLSGFIGSDRYLEATPSAIAQAQSFAALPQSVRTAMQNVAARRSLTVLWNSAEEVFHLGAEAITLTREDVEALVPSFLRL